MLPWESQASSWAGGWRQSAPWGAWRTGRCKTCREYEADDGLHIFTFVTERMAEGNVNITTIMGKQIKCKERMMTYLTL